VVSDLDEASVREKARTFETAYEELRAAAFPQAEDGPRLTVVLFRRARDREAFRPPVVTGEYMDHLPGDAEPSPTIVMAVALWGGRDAIMEGRTFRHELAHAFIHRTQREVPLWLNEGLAQYLSTLRVKDGKAIFGDNPWYVPIAPGVTPTVAQIVSADRATFYGGMANSYEGRAARYGYSIGAWAFVHFLENGPDPIRARFHEFARRVDRGAGTAEAWHETLGTIPAQDLERMYLAYLTSDHWYTFERDVQVAPPSPAVSARTLSDGDVHALWARLSDAKRQPSDPSACARELME
jgi:hypothetical protein